MKILRVMLWSRRRVEKQVGSYRVAYTETDDTEYTKAIRDDIAFGEERGANVYVVEDIVVDGEIRANGFNANGTDVYYNGDSHKFAHELAHLVKRLNGASFEELKKSVKEHFDRETLDKILDGYMNVYEKDYGRDKEAATEEFICDICGNIYVGRTYLKGQKVSHFDGAVRKYFDSVLKQKATDGKSEGDLKLSMHPQWRTDLNERDFMELCRIIRNDIKASTKQITDTANWMLTRIDGVSVFAIYSTEDYKNPTVMYESKGEKGKFERDVLINILEDIEYGESADGKSKSFDEIFSRSWLRQGNGVQNSAQTVERRSGSGDAGVLQGTSPSEPSGALKSVLENLFKIPSIKLSIVEESKSNGDTLNEVGAKVSPNISAVQEDKNGNPMAASYGDGSAKFNLYTYDNGGRKALYTYLMEAVNDKQNPMSLEDAKVFPPYDESYSDANERAMRMAIAL